MINDEFLVAGVC